MKLPLLASTSDVPARIPIRRGVPAESSFAITPGLPNRLATPRLPADFGAEPLQALARLGATGVQVAAQTGTVLIEAEVRRRDADESTQATALGNHAAQRLDSEIERLKVSTDHETLKPAYFEAWYRISAETLAAATTPGVRARLAPQLAGLRTVTQREINTAWRGKYEAYHKGAFAENVRSGIDLTTQAASDLEYGYQLTRLEQTFAEAARQGVLPADVLVEERAKALATVRTDRAYAQAFTAPLTVLQRIGQGEYTELGTRETRSLMEYAESRIRTLRADQESSEARTRRETAAAQDDRAITWRQRIAANYAPGGPGSDLTQDLSGAARDLGESHFQSLQETHRVYRERFQKPVVKTSNPEMVGRAQFAIMTGRFQDVSQGDLLRWFRDGELDEPDYTRLSGSLDAQQAQARGQARAEKTDTERLREQQVKDAEKLIDDYLARGSRFQGDPKARSADILVRDATIELHQRLATDPQANPLEVADEMIARRIADAERITRALPYKSKAEVVAAYTAGRIDKATATRYYRLFDALEKAGGPGGSEAAPPPKPKGLLERMFGTSEESPVRAPVRP